MKSVIEAGNPFKILMVDNKTYDVPHPDYISLPPRGNYVLVYDDEGMFYILPLRTMTAIEGTADQRTDSTKSLGLQLITNASD